MSTEPIHVRVSTKDWGDFKQKCAEKYHKDHNDQLRELIKAFNEGRVTIRLTTGQSNQHKDLYNES